MSNWLVVLKPDTGDQSSITIVRLIPGWSVQTATYDPVCAGAVHVTVPVVLPGKFKTGIPASWLAKLCRTASLFVTTKRTVSPGLTVTCAGEKRELEAVI